MTDEARKIIAKLDSSSVKGVAFEISPKLREATKAIGVQYYASILTLKSMGLSEKEAKVVVDDIVANTWEKIEYCYKENLYEMARKG